jgi:hypothetical protein
MSEKAVSDRLEALISMTSHFFLATLMTATAINTMKFMTV